MSVVNSINQRLGRLNRRLRNSILSIALPRHGKRMFFVVSLFVALGDKDAEAKEALHLLNEKLKVSSTDEALNFPATLSSRVWGKGRLMCALGGKCTRGYANDIAFQEDLQKMCDYVLLLMPSWLRYGSKDEIVQDIKAVVETSAEYRSFKGQTA